MPLPGGASDKFGNRYEGVWTVKCMTDVIAGRAESIRLEPPGESGEGVEFWVKIDSEYQYHQVKRQNSPSGTWTIADLDNKGILNQFGKKLRDSSSSCVFVSTSSAQQIEELCDRSKRAGSYSEFRNEFLKAKYIAKNFVEFHERLENFSDQDAYLALKRIEIEIIGERSLRSLVESELRLLVEGNVANALDVLAQYALDKVHYELTKDEIWKHLEERDIRQRYTSEKQIIAGDFNLPAPIYFVGHKKTLEELDKALVDNIVIIVGGLAGIGKTYLISKYIDGLDISHGVLWLDCVTYGDIEKALLRLSEFYYYRYGDESLSIYLRNPSSLLARRIEVAANLCDKYQCTLVFDGFDPEKHQTLIPFMDECTKSVRLGKIIITARTFIDFFITVPPYSLIVPPLTTDAGVDLMRHYLQRLGIGPYPEEVLVEAHEKVVGHPYFLRALIVLSETYPLPEILKTLPQLHLQKQKYFQEQIFSQLSEDARTLIFLLAVLRKPFTVNIIHSYTIVQDASCAFEELLKKFLITRQSKNSEYYEMHDLVREYGLSQLNGAQLKDANVSALNYYKSLSAKTYGDNIEAVHHALEADLLESAADLSEQILSTALHQGLFDFVEGYSQGE